MENTKLYKVTVEISFGDCEGRRELKRETKTQIFETLDDAIRFSKRGGMEGYNYGIIKKQIWKYTVSSVREMQEKEREIIRQVVEKEKYWE